MSIEKAPAAAAPGKSKKLLLIGIAAVVLVGGGAGGWFFMQKGKPAEGAAAHAGQGKADAHAAAIYHKFDPPFVVNFGGAENSRFLQITVEVQTRDPALPEMLKANEPAIRNDLVLLFSGQQYETLMTTEGKENLRKQTGDAIRKVVAHEGAKPEAVENVFFTSFVIQ